MTTPETPSELTGEGLREPDVRRLAAAMRAVDVVEKRPVDKYVGLASEIVAAILAALPNREAAPEGLRETLADYFKATDDIRDAGEARLGDPHLIAAMYRDAGDRKRKAEAVLRAALATPPGDPDEARNREHDEEGNHV
jgi:hypothetical protein